MRSSLLALLATCSVAAAAAAPGTVASVRGVATVAGRGEPNVVVWLEGGPAGEVEPRQPVLDQRDLQFWPQVLAVRVGATVRFPNDDRVFHNVFSFRDGKKFDLGVYPIGAVKFVQFDRPGVSRLFCNIHPQMAAYVVAVDSSYFAVSAASGVFAIDAPAGEYRYHAWRAGAEVREGHITVGAGGPFEITW